VDIDVAEAREIEHPLGDDPAIGDDNNGVWSDGFQMGAELKVVLDALRLENRKAEASGKLLDEGNLKLLLTASGAVRLGKDQGDFVAGINQGLQAGDGEFGGSTEDEFQGSPRSFGAYHSPCF
jgi:hypothetical protein